MQHHFLNLVEREAVQPTVATPGFEPKREALLRERVLVLIFAIRAFIATAALMKIGDTPRIQTISYLDPVESAKFPANGIVHAAFVAISVC